jgi:hypothetical protein
MQVTRIEPYQSAQLDHSTPDLFAMNVLVILSMPDDNSIHDIFQAV